MTLPDMKSKATLDISEFRKGTAEMLADLRQLADLSKKVGTLKVTADLSAAKDAQRVSREIHTALQHMVPADLQTRIGNLFNGFKVVPAQETAPALYAAQANALKARLTELGNAMRITRAEFQSGIGEATPEEVAKLTTQLRRLKGEMEALQPEVKQTFGEWSAEAVKAANATRTAEATIAAAHGQISRLGLASQVKLGVGSALAGLGPQAQGAVNGLAQYAKASETARLSSVFFEKQLQRNNVQLSEGRKAVDQLSGAFNVMPNVTEEAFKVLMRNGYTLQQATEAMKLYAGSALAAGNDVGAAWNALAQDVMTGTTVLSNAQGISANQATSWQQYAKAIGTTTDKLTAAQKAEGFLVQLRKEASQELQDAKEILEGYAGSAGEANLQLQRAQQELGQNFLPLLTNGTRAMVGFLEVVNQLPEPVRNVGLAVGAVVLAAGLLAGPIGNLVTLYGTLTTARAAAAGAAAVEAAAETAITGAIVRQNAAKAIQKILLADVSVLWAKATTTAMLYSGGMNVAAGSTNVLTGSLTRLGATLKTVMGATSIWTVAALAAGAAGYLWGNAVKETTKVYEQMDAANEAAFEKTMARVNELRKSGTELGRAQARVLVLQQALTDAQQGPLKGVNALTGERIYGKPDEARIKQLQTDLGKARENVTLLYTEAQRRGALNLKLTEDQTKAVKELNKVLEGRTFDLKLVGMTDMQRDLARLGKEFDTLRKKFKEPFYANGKLMDPAQTPALRDGLGRLDAQLLAEQQAARKKYADEAVKTARESALGVQRGEIEAMRDGAGKRAAQRQFEIDEINRATAEKTKVLKDFPDQQKQLEEDARKTIAAKRRQWAAEDVSLARESAKRVADAEKAARDARISSMADGLQKEEALRAAALADLKASIAEQVKALESDPSAQAGVAAAGREQVSALIAQQARERAEALRAVNQQVHEAQQSARSAEIAAIADETQRRRAQREQELAEIRQQAAEKVRSLAGYGQQQVAVQEAARRTIAAKQRQWGIEDEKEAKERAQRIADAWERVAQAQFGAQQAGRGAQSSQYELGLARQLAAAKDNAVKVAQIEQAAVRERARMASEGAAAQYAEEQRRLLFSTQRTLADTKLGADERKAVWAAYYADLDALGKKYSSEESGRLKQQEADARVAVEALRAAYLTESNKPIQASEDRSQQLQWAKELSRSDAEILSLNQKISAEREVQMQALQGQLLGLNGVVLTTEQRRDVENRIKALQHDQTVALREQAEAQQALKQSVLDRLDAEAAYAERTATTDDGILSARLQAKAALQARLRVLDSQVAGEGREAERNALLVQRLELLGRIEEVQTKIDAMPGEAEQRRVSLMQTQRGYLLELAGLGDDSMAQAQARVLSAAEEVRLAQQKVALAETQASRETAQTELVGKRTAYLQAQHQLTLARNEQENQALDLMQARAKAELQLRDLADDAVASAQLDLDITRQKLALIGQQQERGGVTPAEQVALQRQQVELTAQQAQQERTLSRVQRDRVRLLEGLADAQRDLNTELSGSARRASPLQTAYQGIATARTALARAERDYQEAQASGKPDQQKTATEALTAAIRGQREAVLGLADAYRQQISAGDAVRESAARLREVAYGEGQPFQGARELERLMAIQARRDAAQQTLQRALQSGQAKQIAEASDELAKQEKRLQEQAALLDKNGHKNAYTLTGQKVTRQLADQVDKLGIQTDREAVALSERARIADQEAQAVMNLGGMVDRWENSNRALGGLLATLPRVAPVAPPALNPNQLQEVLATLSRSAPTQSAVNHSYTLNVGGITINAPSNRAPDVRRAVDEALDNRLAEAKRKKAFGDMKC